VDADEFGIIHDPDTGTIGTGPRYSWLGQKQRATDAGTTGLTLMGVRLYTPTLGRFTSVDPVTGGNATSYGYPTDPLNESDLDGRRAAVHERGSYSEHITIPRKVLSQIRKTGWDCGSRRGCWSAPAGGKQELVAMCNFTQAGGRTFFRDALLASGGSRAGQKVLLKIGGKVAARAVPVAGQAALAWDGLCTLLGN
jgi:RHS repeat-associated protein